MKIIIKKKVNFQKRGGETIQNRLFKSCLLYCNHQGKFLYILCLQNRGLIFTLFIVCNKMLILHFNKQYIFYFFADGVVLIDPEYINNRKVFGHVLAAFRYGREDLDVLGLTFRKDLFLAAEQIYPRAESYERPLTRLQVRVLF